LHNIYKTNRRILYAKRMSHK